MSAFSSALPVSFEEFFDPKLYSIVVKDTNDHMELMYVPVVGTWRSQSSDNACCITKISYSNISARIIRTGLNDECFNWIKDIAFDEMASEVDIEPFLRHVALLLKDLPFGLFVPQQSSKMHQLFDNFLKQHVNDDWLRLKPDPYIAMVANLDAASSAATGQNQSKLVTNEALARDYIQAMHKGFSMALDDDIMSFRLASWRATAGAEDTAPVLRFVVYDEASGQPASTAALFFNQRDAQLAHINKVATVGEYRHRGYATAAVTACLEHAKRRGVKFVSLTASTDGFSVYQKLGFEPCGLAMYYWKIQNCSS